MLLNLTISNYVEDRSDILTMDEDVLIRYVVNLQFPLLVHFHLELHRNTDKVGSVITFSVCFFVCMFFYVLSNFLLPLLYVCMYVCICVCMWQFMGLIGCDSIWMDGILYFVWDYVRNCWMTLILNFLMCLLYTNIKWKI